MTRTEALNALARLLTLAEAEVRLESQRRGSSYDAAVAHRDELAEILYALT